MAYIFEVNTPSHRRPHVNWMKQSLYYIFRSVPNVSIGIICDIPSIIDTFGEISIMCLIDIPYIQGKSNYFSWIENNNQKYLYSLCLGFRIIQDNNIIEVNDNSYVSIENSIYNYDESVRKDSDKISREIHNIVNGYFECELFDWIYSNKISSPSIHDYAIVGPINNLEEVIVRAANRKINSDRRYDKACKCFYLDKFKTDKNGNKLALFIYHILNGINERTKIGVLTKKKINQICDKRNTKTVEKISSAQGHQLCIITGKAGCGKTMAILKAMYYILKENHRVRLLTYNHLLVKDLSQTIRNIPGINSNNASIWTLHKFMYERSKDLHIVEFLSNSRKEELVDILMQRIKIAEQIISEFLLTHNAFPSCTETLIDIDGKEYKIYPNEIIIRDCGNNILETDRIEILEYIAYVISHSTLSPDERSQNYLKDKITKLTEIKPGEYFLGDYNKVLETMYSMLDNTHKFYEENDVRHRRLFLANIRMSSFLSGEEGPVVEEEEFNKLIKTAAASAKWTNTIFVDEAQDCNIYEKLILMKLRGADHLVVATGGKDQLIRTSKELNWSTINNLSVPTLSLTLPRKSHRQKGNIVSFVNQFAGYYKLNTSIESTSPMDDRGRVILDYRISKEGSMPIDVIGEMKNQGLANGCSAYESILMLLPEIGYTKKTTTTVTQVSDADYISTNITSHDRQLNISEISGINIWSGVDSQKGQLGIANHNQTRFIYYDSCRGLEAWSVLCIDLDSFYYTKKNSNEAKIYASQNLDIFNTVEELQNKYAFIWCYMAFTRAIDTLYIRVRNPMNDFSKSLMEIAEKCGDHVEIWGKKESTFVDDVLPF